MLLSLYSYNIFVKICLSFESNNKHKRKTNNIQNVVKILVLGYKWPDIAQQDIKKQIKQRPKTSKSYEEAKETKEHVKEKQRQLVLVIHIIDATFTSLQNNIVPA